MLLTGRNLAKSYGTRLLFAGITLGLDEGERVGLIGANGSGKSTLLRLLAGLVPPDEGELVSRRGLRVGYVPQEDVFEPAQSCLDCVAAAIDAHVEEHERQVRAGVLLDRAGFVDPSAVAGTLSGGWRKRLAVTRELARDPELLLLDEPTNHLDVEGILWLEDLLDGARFATLTVSHDRQFLEEVATRLVELGRAYPGGYLSHPGAYSEFLEKREEFLATQEGRERALASGVRREIEWLRRGAKARTTKSKGRIERAGEMVADLAELRARNNQQGAARIDFAASERKTRKLLELKGVSARYEGADLFRDVAFTLSPGVKLGLLGPNGSGKTTLIRILAGDLPPDAGEVKRAADLRVVVFDQHREQLDLGQALRHALSPAGETVTYAGGSMHVSGWARRFLFRAEQLDLAVGELSGGEQARVLLARLMLRPADVLILDEPTNDLDIPTLEVLESSLAEFPGALVLVTHDRYLLNRLSTELLALDGKGCAHAYSDLSQWERARDAALQAEAAAKKAAVSAATGASRGPARPAAAAEKKRLSWSEQRELSGMEEAILKAEGEVESLRARVTEPAVLSDHVKLHEAYERLGRAQHEVERLYERWSALDARK